MLNSWGNRYTDIGGGVAKSSNGLYVFVLDVCLVVGQSSGGSVPDSTGLTTSGDISVAPTADTSNYIYGVTIATPQADGSIKTHCVIRPVADLHRGCVRRDRRAAARTERNGRQR